MGSPSRKSHTRHWRLEIVVRNDHKWIISTRGEDFDRGNCFQWLLTNTEIWLQIDLFLYMMRFWILMMIDIIIFLIIFNYVKVTVIFFIISFSFFHVHPLDLIILSNFPLIFRSSVLEPNFDLERIIGWIIFREKFNISIIMTPMCMIVHKLWHNPYHQWYCYTRVICMISNLTIDQFRHEWP